VTTRGEFADAAASAEVSFASPAEPVASVIVLAWRLTHQLLECLRALAASEGAPAFEVQVVLNGAGQPTRDIVASHVRGAHVVDLDANVGFGGGCNAAALRSRGTYLILLNDDAIVEPGWLATLVDSAQHAPKKTGAIASVLLNPDGTLQEAGSRVRAGAGTVQFGKGSTLTAAREAGLLTRRPIDYGSGAALLIRRDAFEEIGGFDPRYEPAYYEDVDLCFRLRVAGWQVLLEPEARVHHASGASTDRDRRFRDFASDRSGSRFIQRWAPTLAAAPEPTAPAKVLCDPSLSAANLTDAPTEVRDPIPSAHTALEIAQGYQGWLNQKLDQALEAVIVEQHLRATDAERIAQLTEEATHLRNRLIGLEQAGPLGVLRWRLGLIRRRLRARKRIGTVKAAGSSGSE
jgi:GT2 family glycosyltransferase